MTLGQNRNARDTTTPLLARMLELTQAIRDHITVSRYSDVWTPQLYTLPTGRSKAIAHRQLDRRRLLIWTDAGNATPVWIGTAPYNGTDAPNARDGYVALAAGSAVLELYTTGEVHAWSSSGGNVYRIAEMSRG